MLNDIAAGVTSLLKSSHKTFRISEDGRFFIEIEGQKKEITEEKFRKLNGSSDIVLIESQEIPEGVKGVRLINGTFERKEYNAKGFSIITDKEFCDEIARTGDRLK
jgi:hypothetical protein